MAKTISFGTEIFSSAMSVLCRSQQSIPSVEDKTITLDEVAWHDTPGDCWIIVYDRVYDITDFLDEVRIKQPVFTRTRLITPLFSLLASWWCRNPPGIRRKGRQCGIQRIRAQQASNKGSGSLPGG